MEYALRSSLLLGVFPGSIKTPRSKLLRKGALHIARATSRPLLCLRPLAGTIMSTFT